MTDTKKPAKCLMDLHDIVEVVARALTGDERAMSLKKRLAAEYDAIEAPTPEQKLARRFARLPLSRHRKNAELAARKAAEAPE